MGVRNRITKTLVILPLSFFLLNEYDKILNYVSELYTRLISYRFDVSKMAYLLFFQDVRVWSIGLVRVRSFII